MTALLLLIALDAIVSAVIVRAIFWFIFVRETPALRRRAEMRALARYSDQIGAGGGAP